MATLEEVLVMVPFLWDDRATPYPHQLGRFDSLEARREEIKKRCELAGTILRVVFDHKKFTSHLRAVAARAKAAVGCVGVQAVRPCQLQRLQ